MDGLNKNRTENLGSPVVEKTPAQESWFNAWLEGNVAVPQTNVGVAINVANIVLHESDFDFTKFRNSTLTEAQRALVEDIMNKIHARRGVSVSTHAGTKYFKSSQPPEDKSHTIIQREALDLLWQRIKEGLAQNITFYKRRAKKEVWLVDEEEIFKDACLFLAERPKEFVDLKILLEFTYKLFRSDDDIKQVFKIYRQEVATPTPPDKTKKDIWPEMGYENILKKMVRERMVSAELKVDEKNIDAFLESFLS